MDESVINMSLALIHILRSTAVTGATHPRVERQGLRFGTTLQGYGFALNQGMHGSMSFKLDLAGLELNVQSVWISSVFSSEIIQPKRLTTRKGQNAQPAPDHQRQSSHIPMFFNCTTFCTVLNFQSTPTPNNYVLSSEGCIEKKTLVPGKQHVFWVLGGFLCPRKGN